MFVAGDTSTGPAPGKTGPGLKTRNEFVPLKEEKSTVFFGTGLEGRRTSGKNVLRDRKRFVARVSRTSLEFFSHQCHAGRTEGIKSVKLSNKKRSLPYHINKNGQ